MNSDENENSFRFLVRVNNMCEWMDSIYIKYIIVHAVAVVMPCFISVVYGWLRNEHLNAEDWFHVYPIV